MDSLTRAEFRELMVKPEGKCVSLYFSTPRSGAYQENAIRFKNLLREAEGRLVRSGCRSPEARKLLAPAHALLADRQSWSHRADGLAAFLSSGNNRFYRLPHSFDELVVVSHRFHLKPLFPVISGDRRFWILALSQKQVRLLQATRFGVTEIEAPGVPAGIDEALKYDNPERQLQFHTKTPVSKDGRRAAIFHGHGGVGSDDPKDRIKRYLRLVDNGLRARLGGAQGTPLVLAGVRYMLDLYREVSAYPQLLKEEIEGSPDQFSPGELQQRGWPLVEPRTRRAEAEAASLYREAAAKGRTCEEIREIVPGAGWGRVEILFVQGDRQVWGDFNPVSGEVVVHEAEEPGDEDLLDLAAVDTLTRDGSVHVVPQERLPGNGPACALLRY